MSAESFRPKTTQIEPGIMGLPRWFTTTREVPAEYESPARGSVLGTTFGAEYADHIVMDAQVAPQGGKKVATVTHCDPAAWYQLHLTSARVSQDGAFLSIRQIVPVPTQAEIEADEFSTYEPIDETKSLKITLVPRKRSVNGAFVDGYSVQQVKRKGVGSRIPAKFKRFVTTKVTAWKRVLQSPSVDEIPEPLDLVGDQVLIQHQKLNDHQYEETITEEKINQAITPLAGEKTDTFGMNTTHESYVDEGTAADSEEGVKSSQVVPDGQGKAQKTTERWPAESVRATLIGQEHDETTGIVIDTEKHLVHKSAAIAAATSKRGDGWYTELRPIDFKDTIMICSKLDVSTLPGPETWGTIMGIRIPGALQEAGIIWDANSNGGAGSAGVNDIPNIIAKKYNWNVSAQSAVFGSIKGRPYTKATAGISGNANVSVTRTYHVGPPPAGSETATRWETVYGYLTIHGVQQSMSARASENGVGEDKVFDSVSYRYGGNTSMMIHRFGPVMHANPTIIHRGDPQSLYAKFTATAGSTPDAGLSPGAVSEVNIAGKASLELPTSSTPPVSGDTYILDIRIIRWRFGIWIKEVYTATVP